LVDGILVDGILVDGIFTKMKSTEPSLNEPVDFPLSTFTYRDAKTHVLSQRKVRRPEGKEN